MNLDFVDIAYGVVVAVGLEQLVAIARLESARLIAASVIAFVLTLAIVFQDWYVFHRSRDPRIIKWPEVSLQLGVLALATIMFSACIDGIYWLWPWVGAGIFALNAVWDWRYGYTVECKSLRAWSAVAEMGMCIWFLLVGAASLAVTKLEAFHDSANVLAMSISVILFIVYVLVQNELGRKGGS